MKFYIAVNYEEYKVGDPIHLFEDKHKALEYIRNQENMGDYVVEEYKIGD